MHRPRGARLSIEPPNRIAWSRRFLSGTALFRGGSFLFLSDRPWRSERQNRNFLPGISDAMRPDDEPGSSSTRGCLTKSSAPFSVVNPNLLVFNENAREMPTHPFDVLGFTNTSNG